MKGGKLGLTAHALLSCALISGLTGCAGLTPPSSITFTYEVDGVEKSTSFVPTGIKCDSDGLGVNGFSFPEKPYNGVMISDGTPGSFSAWVKEEKVIVFSSDDVAIKATPHEDGSFEYVGEAVVGKVGISEVSEDLQAGEPDLSGAKFYPGRADFVVHCAPTENE